MTAYRRLLCKFICHYHMLPGGYNLIAVANLRVEETDPEAAWLGQAHQLLLGVLPLCSHVVRYQMWN